MSSRFSTLIVAGLLGLSLPATAAPAGDQPAPAADGATTLTGRVAETFGGPFVVETEQGRILVEARGFEGDVAQGDVLTVVGPLRKKVLAAESISRDGTVLFRGPGGGGTAGAPTASIPDTLARLGLTQVAPPERRERRVEIATRDARGRNIAASFDLSGRILELEDVDHDKKRAPVLISGEADALAAVRQAGFAPTGRVGRKKHHFEVEATGAAGEPIEAQVDMSGYVFKTIWLDRLKVPDR